MATQKKSKKTKKRTPKKAAATKAKAEPKVGIIATIIESLSKKAMTKDELLEVLTKKFPERTPEAMRTTVNCQVPTRLASEKGLNITKDKEGRYQITA